MQGLRVTCGGYLWGDGTLCFMPYVESEHLLPERSDDEEAMLAEAFYVRENSRLGCQIQMTPDLDGLKITLAPEE